MGLYTGVPRNRPRNAARAGNNLVTCGICGTVRDYRSRMVWSQIDVPGHPTKQILVHPECKDQPHPHVSPPRPRPWYSPDRVQPENLATSHTDIDSNTIYPSVSTPTITAATFAATGTTSATVAQLTTDPTVDVTGTGFANQSTSENYDIRGRVKADLHNPLEGQAPTVPELRVSTVTNSTTMSFELNSADIAAGTIVVDVYMVPPPTPNDGVRHSNNISLTVTA